MLHHPGGIVTIRMTRSKVAAAVVAVVMTAAGCSSVSGSTPEDGSGQADPLAPSQSENESLVDLSLDQVSEQFLASVCPADTALQVLNSVAVAAGGWTNVSPGEIEPYADGAMAAVIGTTKDLQNLSWPEDLAAGISAVTQEHAQLIVPLDQIKNASTGTEMRESWQALRELPRSGENILRAQLGLGLAWSSNDGCPPPPPVTEPSESTSRPNTSSGAWTTLWQSPSGNLRCGFAPRGSLGVPVVACLDSDTNTLARLPKGRFTQFTEATSSQRAQLPGGFVLDFYQTVSEYGFFCSLEDQGMTCVDADSGVGFVIRRGTAYPI